MSGMPDGRVGGFLDMLGVGGLALNGFKIYNIFQNVKMYILESRLPEVINPFWTVIDWASILWALPRYHLVYDYFSNLAPLHS